MPRSFAWSATILLSTTRDDASLPHPKETVLVGFGVRYLVGSRGQRDGPKIFRSRVIEPPGLTSVKKILDLTVHAPQDDLVCVVMRDMVDARESTLFASNMTLSCITIKFLILSHNVALTRDTRLACSMILAYHHHPPPPFV